VALRILTSLGYAVLAAVAAIQVSGVPTTVEGWVALASAAIIAFWGKFSTNTRIIAPNRAAWTPAERKQEALDALNKGL
jgi:hypothetical protein